jgi:hypothetical protein
MIPMKLFLLPAFVLSGFGVNAQSSIGFQKSFTGVGGNAAYSIAETADGGFIATGRTGGYDLSGSDVSLIKLDMNGGMEWAKTYGGSNEDQGLAVLQTFDGGFMISGNSKSSGNNLGDAYLVKTDAAGNVLWSKTYGGTYADMGLSVQQTQDSGFIVCGYTVTDTIPAPGTIDLLIFKTDLNGTLTWGKHYGGVKNEIGSSIRQTPDGGYIATGISSSFSNGNPNVLLLKTDSIGNVLWSKTYGGSNYDIGSSVRRTGSGEYVIVGYTQSYSGNNNNQIYLLKTTVAGNLLWSKTYGAASYSDASDFSETKDGGYTIIGRKTATFYWQFQLYVIKTDSTGHEEWAKSYGDAYVSAGYSIRQSDDKGYVIAGHRQDTIHAETKMYLIKTDSLGNTGCLDTNRIATETMVSAVETTVIILSGSWGVENNVTTSASAGGQFDNVCFPSVIVDTQREAIHLKCYPNPGTGVFFFEASEPSYSVSIYNTLGNSVFSAETRSKKIKADLSQLPKGVYLYKGTDGKGTIATGRLTIQ